jgi:acyl-CoA thioesterase
MSSTEVRESFDEAEAPVSSPFVSHLGVRVLRATEDNLVLGLPIRPEFLNSGGFVHGGVYASLADSAIGAVIFAQIPRDQMAVTVELSCRYLRAARSGELEALARIVHWGSRTIVAEAEIRLGEELQMKAVGTFMLIARRKPGEVAGAGGGAR